MPIPAGWRRQARAPAACSCGDRYDNFRTGLTFADVRRMMWVCSDDPAEWRRRSRGNVLGFWHELKLQFWWHQHGGCS